MLFVGWEVSKHEDKEDALLFLWLLCVPREEAASWLPGWGKYKPTDIIAGGVETYIDGKQEKSLKISLFKIIFKSREYHCKQLYRKKIHLKV